MSTDRPQKILADHLKRDAFLYVRQSSLRQVFENSESTKRQYALRERAVALGWPLERIRTIDSDLGLSGAKAANRDGFQTLVSEVALGHAGIVLGLEVSRLARNNADWHRLLELAALAKTLILDEDGVYDPGDFNDRLLLGLKGTMSEAELHFLKARLQGGIRNKARRGELELPLPIGLVYDGAGHVVLDPDQQIQASLRLIFETYRQTASASATVRRFTLEGWTFPQRIRRGIGKGDLVWGTLDHSRVLAILHNPRYAGAFAYGRCRTAPSKNLKSMTQIRVAREDWPVLIRNAHPGYIDWAEFERNEQTLKRNVAGWSVNGRGGVPREGVGLLQGRVVCGRCGARMRVRYQQLGSVLIPYYVCQEAAARHADRACQSIRGREIDAAVGALLLEAVAPAALEVALAVNDEISNRIEAAEAVRQAALEHARYDAELARRRYIKVDPEHRLVADSLEAEWNDRLRRLDALTQEHERQRRADRGLLDEAARVRIRSLAEDFPRVWQDPCTAQLERKRMVALLIEDVTLNRAERIAIHVRFRGGQTASMEIDRPKPIALIRKTRSDVVVALDELLERCSDDEASSALNARGYRNWKGQPFTAKRTRYLRIAYRLTSRFERLRARGYLTGVEMARQARICLEQVHILGREGILPREHYGQGLRCLYAPLNGATLVKGAGGRYRPRRPKLIPARSSTQETV
jgi:DNA invertase Pin-like site-specific DNA recombinase